MATLSLALLIAAASGCDISIDLVMQMPSIENGHVTRAIHTDGDGETSVTHHAPFAMQARVWVLGNVAKGVWIVHPTLPLRTVLVGRDKQLKVKAEAGCRAAQHGHSSFEVIRTYDTARKAKTGVYNLLSRMGTRTHTAHSPNQPPQQLVRNRLV